MSDATPNIVITRTTEEHLDALVPLFDAYRQFYAQTSDPSRARAFLSQRLRGGDSTIFLALVGGVAVGFAQLYPAFSSVQMRTVWILNDLFVASDARRGGIGAALLRRAHRHAQNSGAVRLTLQTARDNLVAQAIYKAEGWVRDDVFLTYTRDAMP